MAEEQDPAEGSFNKDKPKSSAPATSPKPQESALREEDISRRKIAYWLFTAMALFYAIPFFGILVPLLFDVNFGLLRLSGDRILAVAASCAWIGSSFKVTAERMMFASNHPGASKGMGSWWRGVESDTKQIKTMLTLLLRQR